MNMLGILEGDWERGRDWPSAGGGIICVLQTQLSIFSCPCNDSQGALRFAPVCPSVHHALWYSVYVLNSSHRFQWIFFFGHNEDVHVEF